MKSDRNVVLIGTGRIGRGMSTFIFKSQDMKIKKRL